MKATIKLSILFVDDDPLDRTRFVEAMTAADSPHDVLQAGSVAEARSLREFAASDVIICRDRLPDGSALDLLERGSQRGAILVVAPGDEAMAAEGASFGVRDYVVRDEARKHLCELPWRIEFVFRRALARQRSWEQVRILDLAPVLVRDLEDRIILWNRGAERLYGWPSAEAVGWIVHERLRTMFPQPLTEIRAELFERGSWFGEVVHTTARDARIAVDTQWILHRNERGDPAAIIEVNNEVTGHVQAEGRARQAQRFIQQAIDALPDQVAILDDHATIIAVNAAWRRFSQFGAGAGTCCGVGDNFLAVCGATACRDAHETQVIAACIGQLMKDGHGEFRSEACAATPQGRKWFQLRGTRFHDGDKLFLLLVLEDISEVRAAAEEVRHLNENLERRVMARTAQLDAANRELRREIAERQRLEREVVKVSEDEQERLGQDLHDDLGQQLSGIAMLSSVLEASLRAEAHAKTEAAARLAALLREAVRATRDLARGLFPVDLQHGGLILTLTELAQRTEALSGVHCEVRHKRAFRYEQTAAIHLYRIAQEALNNAVRHGQAHNVTIECTTSDGVPALIVTDDGVGFKTPKKKWAGIGLHLYRYRARVIGAQIKVARGEHGGCKVMCLLKRPASGRTDGWRERSSRKLDSRLVPD